MNEQQQGCPFFETEPVANCTLMPRPTCEVETCRLRDGLAGLSKFEIERLKAGVSNMMRYVEQHKPGAFSYFIKPNTDENG